MQMFNYNKVFEDTDKNPLGMYMLDHIQIPDAEHQKVVID